MSIFDFFKKERKQLEPKSIIDVEALGLNPLFEDAAKIVVERQDFSLPYLQRVLGIDYTRAREIAEDLEITGVVGPITNSMIPQEVLIHDEKELYALLSTICYKMISEYKRQTPIQCINRLRMGTDGDGITTLVAFHGCPLRCKYCLNPSSISDTDCGRCMLPEDVMKELKKDELYYIATKGGVTFGGGEPLLYSLYIKNLLELGAKEWNVTVETSLNVPKINIEMLLPYINEYIVDIKDMNSDIYKSYTGKSNRRVKENLKWLIGKGMSDRIVCRIPLIPYYNNESDQRNSKKELSEMGIKRFDLFTYTIEGKRTEQFVKRNRFISNLKKFATQGLIDEE